MGHYFLYVEGDAKADDEKTVHEETLKSMFVSRFGRQRESFGTNLKCEDYEHEGLIALGELSEAITSTDEEVEDRVLDYMLYYVFVRSESAERMAYKTLTSMLDERPQNPKTPCVLFEN